MFTEPASCARALPGKNLFIAAAILTEVNASGERKVISIEFPGPNTLLSISRSTIAPFVTIPTVGWFT